MNYKDKFDKSLLLQRIARYLMLHGSFCNNIGLLNGKTGISIFFYHYARYTGKKRYDDFAGELIDEIYKEIHTNTVLCFNDGLCGIGWGIEYLIRNGFVKADPDEVMRDLDKRITEWDVRKITDHTLETGLAGIACYVISRMENKEKEHEIITMDYIEDLIEALKKNTQNINLELIEVLEMVITGKVSVLSNNPLFKKIDKIRCNIKNIFEKPRLLGIEKAGYAGIGMQLMGISEQ